MAAKIIFLDDSEDLRVLMNHIVTSKLGENCLCVKSVSELLDNELEVLGSKLAIIDINLGEGEPNGLDAYAWFKKMGYQGQIFFLTGHARSHPLVSKACESGARVWAKPILTSDIVDAIEAVLKPSEVVS